MEERVTTETEGIVLQGDTSLCLRLLQLVERLEAAIGDGLVGEWPDLAATQIRGKDMEAF
jgi:hypothetical protein